MLNSGIKHKTTAPFKPSSIGNPKHIYIILLRKIIVEQYAKKLYIITKNTLAMQHRKAPKFTIFESSINII